MLSLDELDAIIPVPDGDAILMAQKLARDLGLGVGISSGANFLAALEAQERLSRHEPVCACLCRSLLTYSRSLLHRSASVGMSRCVRVCVGLF